MNIRTYTPEDLDAVVRLSLAAWAPVFESIEQAMDPEVYRVFYPDWRITQRKAVEEACATEGMSVWVAMVDSEVAGFVATRLHQDDSMGEIYMVAVDPAFHRQGIAGALTEFATEQLRQAGMSVAMVDTGGDPGHGPARALYESQGYRKLPVARYFKKL
ncbi:MAG: GNAT family N-acetyltransferase [Acidobacteriota bacterium]